MVVLLAVAALADTVCEVPVPIGLVVEVDITYESSLEQLIQVSNAADLTDAALFSSIEGDIGGRLWSESGFTFRAVHEDGMGGVDDSECLVRYGRGEVTIGFEDSTDGDYNDVQVVLRPDPNVCTIPVAAGTLVEAELDYNAGYDQKVQVGSGPLSPVDVREYDSIDGEVFDTFVAPGGLWFRSLSDDGTGDIKSNKCQVRVVGDSVVIGFEDADDDDYDDVSITLRRG